jgi:hypothetical protein
MNPNREFQKQELTQAVQSSEKVIEEQQLSLAEELADTQELEEKLREAEAAAEKQKEAEEKGQETERKISEVAGA